jgi:hypothetical protein
MPSQAQRSQAKHSIFMEENRNNKVERAVAKLIGGPLEPGTLIKAEVFEEVLGLSRNSQAFSWLISDIRQALYTRGIYLDGEGFSQTGAFEVADPRDHYWYAKLAVAKAERNLEGKLTLLRNTRLDGLSQLEIRRHENIMRELATKLAAMRRIQEMEKLLKRKSRHENFEELSEAELSTAEQSPA